MSTVFLADPPPPVDNTWAAPGVAIPLTLAVAVLMYFLVKAARGSAQDPDEFLLAGRRIGPGQNAVALASAPIMYSTMFIITGHIALSGYDAVLLLTAFTMSMMLGVLVFASPVRNLGVRTLGDLFALRARERPARIASAVVMLLIYAMFTIISMAAVAFIFNRWFGLDSLVLLALMVLVVGLVTVVYVFVGGMRGVTRILVFKAVLAFAVVAVLTTLVLAKFNMNPISLLEQAEANAVTHKGGYDLLGPGRLFGEGSDRWIHLSKLFCIVVGVAAIPFLFMRNFAVTSGRDARKSAGWASMMVVAFYLCLSVVGLGAVAVLGGENIGVIKPHRDISLPKLADDLGGPVMVGTLAVIALLTIVGVFAALLINAVTAVTKDINVVRGRRLAPDAELKDIRRNVVIIGIASVIGGVVMLPVRTHIFIPTSIDVAGAAVLPAVVYALFWRRFNTSGLLWTVYGGIAVTMFMVVFSNGVSAEDDAIFPHADFKFVDIEPGLVSVPVAFLLGYIGTVISRERNDASFAEMQVRALTGATPAARKEAPPLSGADAREPQSRTPSEAH
ncbi:solute symporter family protein [Streptomyces sp. BA2]|uniref:solute symporter family protein n=1 Tax=Streptomyces sp. BA2 TaxID=436595 RepID=UPI001322499F|nr:Na+:solute symporter [Streptomyces sp. BA2]MWA09119.1 Na+:solute symporter [Streptomyces sp. BA2]